MDNRRVCRTCMRVIEDHEAAISINDSELLEKIRVCLPELVLDNVVDPIMCNTCNVSLALSYRFKGMCNEVDKTISTCIQNKTRSGKFKPLSEIDMLMLGRRGDVGDIIIGQSLPIAKEIEVLDDMQANLESLQLLSDVASKAVKADEHPASNTDIQNLCNWEDEIQSTWIERTPRVGKNKIDKHLDIVIEDVVANRSCRHVKKWAPNVPNLSPRSPRGALKKTDAGDELLRLLGEGRPAKLKMFQHVAKQKNRVPDISDKKLKENIDNMLERSYKTAQNRNKNKVKDKPARPKNVGSRNKKPEPKNSKARAIEPTATPPNVYSKPFKKRPVKEIEALAKSESKSKPKSSPKKRASDPLPSVGVAPANVLDGVASAIEELFRTPEYRKLLKLKETSSEGNAKLEAVAQKLKKIEEIYNHAQSTRKPSKPLDDTPVVKHEHKVMSNGSTNVKSIVNLKKRKRGAPLRKKSERAKKARKDIDSDLAEISDGLKLQNKTSAEDEPIPDDTKSKPEPIQKPVKVQTRRRLRNFQTALALPPLPRLRQRKRGYVLNMLKPPKKVVQKKPIAKGKFYEFKEVNGRVVNLRQPPQVCDQCGKVYKYVSHLNVHKRAHNLLKNYKCELCNKSFTVERYLILHTNQHFSAGDNQCLICEKYFSSQHVLRKHERTHTGEKPFLCIVCERAFSQRVNLETHMRIHTGTRSFFCHFCNSSFAQKVHLITHIRTHTGEKPYVCDICPKAFSKKNILRDHKLVHKKKPFMCDGCNIMFRDEVALKRHTKKYSGGLPHTRNKTCNKMFSCGICSRVFLTKFSCDRHMKVHVKDLIEGSLV